MTTDNEAAAVEAIDMALREWFGDATGAGLDGGPEHVEWRRRMRAAIAAHTAASAGEAAPQKAEHVLARAGVFAGHEGLRRFAECDEFWDQQHYGTRLYFGGGGFDYLHRSVLCAAIAALDETASATPPPPAAVPADALERLVAAQASIRGLIAEIDPARKPATGELKLIADELRNTLATLIQKGADHEQR